MNAMFPPGQPTLVNPETIDRFRSVSGEELLKLRDEWESQRTERDADQRLIDVHVGVIDTLIPVANFRGAILPPGGLEVLPGLKLIHCGKVRNTFIAESMPDRRIMIAADRISTHDVVHDALITGKGVSITTMSNASYTALAEDSRTRDIPTQKTNDPLPSILQKQGLESRTDVVKTLRAIPIEAIIRKYLYGSALEGYEKVQAGYLSVKNKQTDEWELGEYVGEELQKCSEFSRPLFTPSTKGEKDININFDGMVKEIEEWLKTEGIEGCAQSISEEIRKHSINIWAVLNEKAQEKGITIADTKFEFGLDEEGKVTLMDEVCTQDSSRCWTTSSIRKGQEPEQFDKQAVRDWVAGEWKRLEKIQKNAKKTEAEYATMSDIEWDNTWKEIWNKMSGKDRKPPLKIPEDIKRIAQKKYEEMVTRFKNTVQTIQAPAQKAVSNI